MAVSTNGGERDRGFGSSHQRRRPEGRTVAFTVGGGQAARGTACCHGGTSREAPLRPQLTAGAACSRMQSFCQLKILDNKGV